MTQTVAGRTSVPVTGVSESDLDRVQVTPGPVAAGGPPGIPAPAGGGYGHGASDRADSVRVTGAGACGRDSDSLASSSPWPCPEPSSGPRRGLASSDGASEGRGGGAT